MDRVMGMLSLMLLAATILGARYDWLSRAPVAAGLVKVVATILGLGAAALVASLVIARAGVLDRPAVPRYLRELGTAFGQFSKDWPRTVAAFFTTLLSHLCYYGSFCCAARALSRGLSPAPTMGDVFSLMPIENTLTALPISFAGIGLRESLFQRLLHDLAGVDPGVGALIGSLGFATKALWALPGAAVFYRPTASARTETSGAVNKPYRRARATTLTPAGSTRLRRLDCTRHSRNCRRHVERPLEHRDRATLWFGRRLALRRWAA